LVDGGVKQLLICIAALKARIPACVQPVALLLARFYSFAFSVG